ncbi:MAG: ribosomal RNA small subunit methyltransferase A [Thermoprotei archaeon]|nr:MAG: ribosomal RNA small subunit methyltransferase A [Thermoprotei archaeon]
MRDAMNLKELTISILRKYNLRPSKRLSQSFLIDERLARRIVEITAPGKGECILEIGAGLGALTRFLEISEAFVVALEIDRKLVRILKDIFLNSPNIDVVNADFLKSSWRFFHKIVSNVPYHLSSYIILKILRELRFNYAVLTLQREFAQRLNASPGTKSYGRISVMTWVFASIKVLDFVPRKAFYPEPKVDSLIVLLKPRQTPLLSEHEVKKFEIFLGKLFSQRRKVISKVISRTMEIDRSIVESILTENAISPQERVYKIPPQRFLNLFKALMRRGFI